MSKNRFALLMVVLLLAAAALAGCGGTATTGQEIAQTVQEIAAQSGAIQTGAGAAALKNATATVSAASLRVRAKPSSDANVIFGIKQGEQYKVIGLSSDGEWVELDLPDAPNGAGWVSANFVTVEGAITDAPVTKVTPAAPQTPKASAQDNGAATPGTATVVTEGTRLRVREEPNGNAKIAGYVYNGEIFPVLETSSDGAWVKIGGRTGTDNLNGGWVAAEFLEVN